MEPIKGQQLVDFILFVILSATERTQSGGTQSAESFLEGLVMLNTPGLRSWKLPLFLLYAMPNVLRL